MMKAVKSLQNMGSSTTKPLALNSMALLVHVSSEITEERKIPADVRTLAEKVYECYRHMPRVHYQERPQVP